MEIPQDLQKQWDAQGEHYAQQINEMVAFAHENGWENWTEETPTDPRSPLALEVFKLLQQANLNNTVQPFRAAFAPSITPIAHLLKDREVCIAEILSISPTKTVFIISENHIEHQAYLINNLKTSPLPKDILYLGKSLKNNVFAIATKNQITTTKGWEGDIIETFNLKTTAEVTINKLIPFNNGSKVVLISDQGTYLLSQDSETLLTETDPEHPEQPLELSMQHACLSNDNSLLVLADQLSDHRVLDGNGNQVCEIYPESSYPHYCLFSSDDTQLLTNSCHFYNGISIGINHNELPKLNKPSYNQDEKTVLLDQEMRVYAGVAKQDYYILGDAYGYIRAISLDGKTLWQHYLGSTISSMSLCENQTTLFVGTYSSHLFKLILDKKTRDTHTIGTASIYEESRLLVLKDQKEFLWW